MPLNQQMYNTFFNPQSLSMSPALGRLIASDPEAGVQALAQAGVEPPLVSADQAGASPFAPHNLLRGVFGAPPLGVANAAPVLPQGPQGAASGGAGAAPSLAGGSQLTAPQANQFYNAVGIPAQADFMSPPLMPQAQPVGEPLNILPPAAGGGTDLSAKQGAGAQPGSSAKQLTDALAGVKAPAAPAAPRVGTPSLPGTRAPSTGSSQLLANIFQTAGRGQSPTALRLAAALAGR